MKTRNHNHAAEDTSQVKCEGLKPQHPQVGDTSTILESLQTLAPYMGRSQWHTLWKLCQQGEEQPHFRQMVQDWAAKIAAMPKTYETNGQGLKAVAHLHYFTRAFDFYITEKDRSGGTKLAFARFTSTRSRWVLDVASVGAQDTHRPDDGADYVGSGMRVDAVH